MIAFQQAAFDKHEEISFFYDGGVMRGIIAVHSVRRGPALGGCRYWTYVDENAALTDALRLSRGMTYKAAMADLPYGGGKSVLLADPARPKDADLFLALGRAVHRLGGRYIVGEDVGVTPQDMEIVKTVTPYVAGLAGAGGDPSEATAFGVWRGIRAVARRALHGGEPTDKPLSGLRVMVQGVGAVGRTLCRYLKNDGARLLVSDLRAEVVRRVAEECAAEIVAPAAVPDADADIYAPCALGAVLNDDTIPRLRVAAVAGSANNQLAEDRHGAALAARGILFAPDYVINAGGLINAHYELAGGYDRAAAFAATAQIEQRLEFLFDRSAAEGAPPHRIADLAALEKLAA